MNIFRDKNILVTGGCGSIGSEIVRQLIQLQPAVVRVLDNNEHRLFLLSQELKHPSLRFLIGDVRDRLRLKRAMQGIDIVFHAAALKHVPVCEYNNFEAVQTNVGGTQNAVATALDLDIELFVNISTDKAVNPTSTMGATKLLAERIVTGTPRGRARTKLCAVRFGNVLASNGSVLETFKEQIKSGGPVTVTDDRMTRFFMSIPESVSLVFEAAKRSKGGEVFILKMNRLRIVDLAQVLIDNLADDPKSVELSIIGRRPGEKLHEALMTEYETLLAEEHEDMFVIQTSIQHAKVPVPVRESKMQMRPLLTQKEIKEMLISHDLL